MTRIRDDVLLTAPLDFRIGRHRAMRVDVMARDSFTCQTCGWKATNVPDNYDGRFAIGAWPYLDERILHVDHIVPRIDGGPNQLDNLRALCESCNVGRGARS